MSITKWKLAAAENFVPAMKSPWTTTFLLLLPTQTIEWAKLHETRGVNAVKHFGIMKFKIVEFMRVAKANGGREARGMKAAIIDWWFRYFFSDHSIGIGQ